MPVLLSFARLDIVLGRVRKTVGGKLMFNQDSGFQCPLPSRVVWVGGVLKGWCLPHQTSTVTPLSQGTNMSSLSLWLLPVWLVLLHLYYACAFPQDLKTMHTPEMENAFNFYVDFYFKYAGLNALEFTRRVLSRLFKKWPSEILSHACS